MRAMVVGEARREAGGKRTAVDKFIKIVDGKWEYTFTGESAGCPCVGLVVDGS